MTKTEAIEQTCELLHRLLGKNNAEAHLAIISAKRVKDTAWMKKQLGEMIDLFKELKNSL